MVDSYLFTIFSLVFFQVKSFDRRTDRWRDRAMREWLFWEQWSKANKTSWGTARMWNVFEHHSWCCCLFNVGETKKKKKRKETIYEWCLYAMIYCTRWQNYKNWRFRCTLLGRSWDHIGIIRSFSPSWALITRFTTFRGLHSGSTSILKLKGKKSSTRYY